MREGGCHQHRWWWPFEKTGHAKSVTNPVTYRAEFDFVCASADVKSRSRCVGATLAKIKKAQTLAPGEIVRIANFSQNPKISPLSTFPLPLGKLISNQLFRDPHSSSIPSVPSPVPSHAREVLTWQNVIFEELRSTLRTSRRPAS